MGIWLREFMRNAYKLLLLNREDEQEALKLPKKGGDLIDCEDYIKSGMFYKHLLHR